MIPSLIGFLFLQEKPHIYFREKSAGNGFAAEKQICVVFVTTGNSLMLFSPRPLKSVLQYIASCPL